MRVTDVALIYGIVLTEADKTELTVRLEDEAGLADGVSEADKADVLNERLDKAVDLLGGTTSGPNHEEHHALGLVVYLFHEDDELVRPIGRDKVARLALTQEQAWLEFVKEQSRLLDRLTDTTLPPSQLEENGLTVRAMGTIMEWLEETLRSRPWAWHTFVTIDW